MGTQFHFRNMTATSHWVGVCHANCGELPWVMGRPQCWWANIADNPTGGDNSVYVPAEWVTDPAQAMDTIIAGLKVVGDIGLAIASTATGEPDASAFADAVTDSIGFGQDIAASAASNSSTSLTELAASTTQSFANACASIKADPAEVRALAAAMGLGDFVLIAGDSYTNLFQNGSSFNSNAGWAVAYGNHNGPAKNVANAVFLSNGSAYYAIPELTGAQLEAWTIATSKAEVSGGAPPALPLLLCLWKNIPS